MPQHMPRTFSDGIPGPGLGQAHKCGWVIKLDSGIPILNILKVEILTAIQIYLGIPFNMCTNILQRFLRFSRDSVDIIFTNVFPIYGDYQYVILIKEINH